MQAPSPTDRPGQPASQPIAAIKLCPRCGQNFNDDGYAAKVYCSIRCRNAMKNKRAIARDHKAGRVGASGGTVHSMPSAQIILFNATKEQLDAHAERLHSGSLTTGVVVRGVIPEWQPKFIDVLFVEQMGTTPREWAMMTEKML